MVKHNPAEKAQAAVDKAQVRYERAAATDAKAQVRAADSARTVAEALAELEYLRSHPALSPSIPAE